MRQIGDQKSRLKEAYRKGDIQRSDPELCGTGREVSHEALTGAGVCEPSRREICKSGFPTLSC